MPAPARTGALKGVFAESAAPSAPDPTLDAAPTAPNPPRDRIPPAVCRSSDALETLELGFGLGAPGAPIPAERASVGEAARGFTLECVAAAEEARGLWRGPGPCEERERLRGLLGRAAVADATGVHDLFTGAALPEETRPPAAAARGEFGREEQLRRTQDKEFDKLEEEDRDATEATRPSPTDERPRIAGEDEREGFFARAASPLLPPMPLNRKAPSRLWWTESEASLGLCDPLLRATPLPNGAGDLLRVLDEVRRAATRSAGDAVRLSRRIRTGPFSACSEARVLAGEHGRDVALEAHAALPPARRCGVLRCVAAMSVS